MFEDRKKWKEKAESLKPKLFEREIVAQGDYSKKSLMTKDRLVIDFENHYVGYVELRLSSKGSHPDAPALLKIKFCENEREIKEDSSDYEGWISKGWIQEEWIHVDVLPAELKLPRRYACRFVVIEVIDISTKFQLIVDRVAIREVTSADEQMLPAFQGTDMDRRIYDVAIRTLRNCMQDVFEDGPKRDRRLWLGDLRLQALTNYETFQNNDLVKRCLYLFAACTDERGRIPSCLFTEPEIEGDDTYNFDYTLFFISVLKDYVLATRDYETLKDLYPVALRQWEISMEFFDERDCALDSNKLGWCFVDWNLELNKQFCAQAIYIYCLRDLIVLAEKMNDSVVASIEKEISKKVQAARKYFYDNENHVFFSGERKQQSMANQIWGVLANIFDEKENRLILQVIRKNNKLLPLVTPYARHCYIEALLMVGDKNAAHEELISYWGKMVDLGADTYWELFNPNNIEESPYGSTVVNSYCHAWSCSPAYYLNKFREL